MFKFLAHDMLGGGVELGQLTMYFDLNLTLGGVVGRSPMWHPVATSCHFSATGNAPKKATSKNGSHTMELTVWHLSNEIDTFELRY